MLIDLHAHTSGISKCCLIPAIEVLKTAKESGMDGIVLTNHYQKSYIKDGDAGEFIERYIKEYCDAKELGKKIGVNVFWGIEVTMALYPSVHMLIYGVSFDFLKNNPRLFDYTQEKLYKTVKESNGAVIQAHPFRNGTSVLNVKYLDGIEVNCHPLYKNSYSGEILNIAGENSLAVTCGGDFHADTYRPKCGVFLPDEITDDLELGEYILNAKEIKLCVHEPDTENEKIITYYKKRI